MQEERQRRRKLPTYKAKRIMASAGLQNTSPSAAPHTSPRAQSPAPGAVATPHDSAQPQQVQQPPHSKPSSPASPAPPPTSRPAQSSPAQPASQPARNSPPQSSPPPAPEESPSVLGSVQTATGGLDCRAMLWSSLGIICWVCLPMVIMLSLLLIVLAAGGDL